MTSESTSIDLERRDAFWFARLNRPGKRNALSEPMLTALDGVCASVEADAEARALVLWGAGGHFCAGADFARFEALMAEPARGDPDPLVTHNRAFGIVLERVAALPVPTIGVVRGAAMGGGCGLAAALDRVVAADDATFAMPEVTLGVAPAQIAPFVVRRVGATRARWMMLGATRLDARAAQAAGLADVVVPVADLTAAVQTELESLARAHPEALRVTKALVSRSLQLPLAAALDAAAADFAALLRSGAPREGIAASRERRAPAWRVEVPPLPEFA